MGFDSFALDGFLQNGTEVTVPNTVGGTLLIAANSNRRKLIVQNVGAVNMRVGTVGVTASGAGAGFRLTPNGVAVFEAPYVNINAIYAISEGANTTALVQETIRAS